MSVPCASLLPVFALACARPHFLSLHLHYSPLLPPPPSHSFSFTLCPLLTLGVSPAPSILPFCFPLSSPPSTLDSHPGSPVEKLRRHLALPLGSFKLHHHNSLKLRSRLSPAVSRPHFDLLTCSHVSLITASQSLLPPLPSSSYGLCLNHVGTGISKAAGLSDRFVVHAGLENS